MIVCHCSIVTARDIEAVVDSGARSVEDVGDATGAGTGCGSCHPTIESIMAQRCAACPQLRLVVA